MLLVLFKLMARIPLALLHSSGRLIGKLVYLLPGRYRLRLRRNARQAGYFDPAFARRASGETAAMALETPRVWLRPEQCLAITASPDEAVVEAARKEGRGILYLTPHLGSFEITARYIAQSTPITVMYRPPRWQPLEPVMNVARNLPNLRAVPANMKGVREFVRALRKGEAVGMLPDQVPRGGEGVWTPFFERPAYTMTLAARLALQLDAIVILTAGERLPRGKGWRIHYERLPEPFSQDINTLTLHINQAMEQLIQRFPEQYLWSYSRYKGPDGAPPKPDFPPFP